MTVGTVSTDICYVIIVLFIIIYIHCLYMKDNNIEYYLQENNWLIKVNY